MSIKTEGLKVRVNSKEVGCLDDLGTIKQTREPKTKQCINSDTVRTILGNISTDPIPLSVAYDPTDSAGAGELATVFNTGSECVFEIELSDTAGTNGTTFSWANAVVSDYEINPNDDGEVIVTFTLHPGGKPTVTAAA